MVRGIVEFNIFHFLGKLFGLAGIAAGTFLGTFLSPFSFFNNIKKRTENLIFQNNIFILKHFLFSIIPSIIVAYLINQSQSKLSVIVIYTTLLSISYIALSYWCLPENINL